MKLQTPCNRPNLPFAFWPQTRQKDSGPFHVQRYRHLHQTSLNLSLLGNMLVPTSSLGPESWPFRIYSFSMPSGLTLCFRSFLPLHSPPISLLPLAYTSFTDAFGLHAYTTVPITSGNESGRWPSTSSVVTRKLH